MEYRITGSIVPAVEIALQAGESMYTQSGGMSWKTEGIEMSTNTRGGLLKGIGRMFSGESLFMATYTASRPGIIAFASTVPGSVLPVSLEQTGTLIIQKGAFLCAQPSVSLEITFTKKLSSGFFGGEGFYPAETVRKRHGFPGNRRRCRRKDSCPRRDPLCRHRKCCGI